MTSFWWEKCHKILISQCEVYLVLCRAVWISGTAETVYHWGNSLTSIVLMISQLYHTSVLPKQEMSSFKLFIQVQYNLCSLVVLQFIQHLSQLMVMVFHLMCSESYWLTWMVAAIGHMLGWILWALNLSVCLTAVWDFGTVHKKNAVFYHMIKTKKSFWIKIFFSGEYSYRLSRLSWTTGDSQIYLINLIMCDQLFHKDEWLGRILPLSIYLEGIFIFIFGNLIKYSCVTKSFYVKFHVNFTTNT